MVLPDMHIFKIIVVSYYYYSGYEFWFREFFPVLSKSKSKYGFVSNINEGHRTNSQRQKIYKIIIKAKTNKL